MADENNGVDGAFPRLNASLLRQGSWTDSLASLVGKFEDRRTFRCADGGTVSISDDDGEMEGYTEDSVVEIMGQVIDQTTVTVRLFMEIVSAWPSS